MSGFSNPIVGGGGDLVYPQIQSPNFQALIDGWQIAKDGSAQFNNVTIRGNFAGFDYLISSTGIFFYYGTPAFGNLALAMVPTATTDTFGNAVPDGISLSTLGGVGNEIQLRPSKDAIFLYAG